MYADQRLGLPLVCEICRVSEGEEEYVHSPEHVACLNSQFDVVLTNRYYIYPMRLGLNWR